MKRFYPILSALILFALVAVGLKLKASPAVPPVYDTKSFPGSNCRVAACSWSPTTVVQVQRMVMNVGPGTFSIQQGPASTDTCDVICPILRDRYWDQVGPRNVEISINMQPLAGGPFPNRHFTCRVLNSTGPYTVPPLTDVRRSYQLGPLVTSPASQTNGILDMNLPIPYPPGGTVPAEAWAHGATYAGGASAILCTLPADSVTYIESYRWAEYGGESTDY